MNKYIGVSAILTMLIASGYILYTNFYTKAKNSNMPATSEIVGTTTDQEETKPAIEKSVVKNVTPTTASDTYVMDLGDTINVYGLSFKKPTNWLEEQPKIASPEKGYSFITNDFNPAVVPDSVVFANNNGVKTGLRISISNRLEEVNPTIEGSEAYQAFQFKLLKDTSNSRGGSKVNVGGVPAIFSIYNKDDYGGWATYSGHNNGRTFNISIEFTDTYEVHADLFNKFISGVTFTN